MVEGPRIEEMLHLLGLCRHDICMLAAFVLSLRLARANLPLTGNQRLRWFHDERSPDSQLLEVSLQQPY